MESQKLEEIKRKLAELEKKARDTSYQNEVCLQRGRLNRCIKDFFERKVINKENFNVDLNRLKESLDQLEQILNK